MTPIFPKGWFVFEKNLLEALWSNMGLVTWGIPHHGGYLFFRPGFPCFFLLGDAGGGEGGELARSWRAGYDF